MREATSHAAKNIKNRDQRANLFVFWSLFFIFLGRSHLATDATKAQRSGAEVPHERVNGSKVMSLIQVHLEINVYVCIFLWGEAPNGGAAIAATELHGFIRRQ